MSIIQPPSTGFPDWSSQSLYDGPTLVSVPGSRYVGFQQLYFGSVRSWWGTTAQINIRSNGTSASTNRALVQYTWFCDQAKTEQIAQLWLYTYRNYIVWNGLVIPNYGPWLRIGVQGDASDDPVFEVLIAATNRAQAVGALPLVEQVLYVQDVVSAGQTNMYVPNSQMTGPCVVSMVSDQALTWTFGTASGMALEEFPLEPLVANTYKTFLWYLPLSQWQFNVTNPGGTNANINMIVNTQP